MKAFVLCPLSFVLPPSKVLVPPHVLLLRRPDARLEELRVGVLRHMARIGGDALAATAVPPDLKPVVIPAFHQRFLDDAFPYIRILAPEAFKPRVDRPVREIAHEPHARRIRRPFAEYPPLPDMMKAVVFMRARPAGETAAAGELGRACRRPRASPSYRRLIRLEIQIIQKFHE